MRALTLWLVQGTTGEYSDRNEWPVAVCVSEAAAQKLEDACVEWARKAGIHTSSDPITWGSDLKLDALVKRVGSASPDPQVYTDYTGVDYTHYRVELRLHNSQEYIDFGDALVAAGAEIRSGA